MIGAVRIASVAALVLASGLLAAGYWADDALQLALFALLPLLLWWLAQADGGGRWRSNLITRQGPFVLLVVLCMIGAIRGLNVAVLLAAMLSAFVHWDLMAFQQRLAQFPNADQSAALLRRHLQMISAIIGVTIGLSLIIFNARLEIGLWTAIALGAIVMTGVAQAIRYLRESDL